MKIQIQKCVRGFIGRRKASAVREHQLKCRVSVAIQAAWRGLLGRRKAGERRREVEALRVCYKTMFFFVFFFVILIY